MADRVPAHCPDQRFLVARFSSGRFMRSIHCHSCGREATVEPWGSFSIRECCCQL